MSQPLADRISRAPAPADPGGADRALDGLKAEAGAPPENAEALLRGAFGNSPYLARLARRFPKAVLEILAEPPEARLEAELAAMARAAEAETPDALHAALRQAKARIHLLTALADLGGVWDLDAVTGALTGAADAALEAAVAAHARFLGSEAGAGYFIVALGKQGAGELNYSSDIDIACFYDPERAAGDDPAGFAVRLTRRVAAALSEQTGDGYVFRVDLRLRPDPYSTPVAISADAASHYYESTALTWERAAWIKSRVAAGDAEAGAEFLEGLQPFVWRRAMDFAAIDEIAAIMKQINDAGGGKPDTAAGFDLKRGPGGIRHIEFFAQVQQLLWGGREEALRSPATLDALSALAKAEHVEAADAETLARVYRRLRDIEHRAQMIEDQQTQEAPEAPEARHRLAMLSGAESLEAFDEEVLAITEEARSLCAELFADAPEPETLLSFEGVEPAPATLRRLRDGGFTEPERAWEALHAWMAGQPRALRSERARRLARKLAPRIAEEISGTPSPDATLRRFDEFIRALPAGVQILSMLDREPRLLTDLTDILGLSPHLARELSARPEALEAFLAFDAEELDLAWLDGHIAAEIKRARDLEEALDRARRLTRETMFLIGMAVLRGDQTADQASEVYSALAAALIRALAPRVRAELARRYGEIDGDFAIVAFGSFGAAEMTFRSDTDIVMVYEAPEGAESKGERPVQAETWFNRLAQRFVSALSAPTAEGSLFNIDLNLRPHGSAGPVASRFAAYEQYYRSDAWTWELMALTRAHVVAGPEAFAERLDGLIHDILTQKRDAREVARNVADMRARLDREKPPSGFWDLVQSPGALTDVRFAVQYLQLVHAAAHPGVLKRSTRAAVAALREHGVLSAEEARALDASAELHLDLRQIFALAAEGPFDPATAPLRLKRRLARACGVEDFSRVETRIRSVRSAARTVFETRVLKKSDGNGRMDR